jgi:hypothetical protein
LARVPLTEEPYKEGLERENTKKGYELRERVSEREGLHIESNYYWNFNGDKV